MIPYNAMLDDHFRGCSCKTEEVFEDLSTVAGSDISSADDSSCYGEDASPQSMTDTSPLFFHHDRYLSAINEDILQSCSEDDSEGLPYDDEEEEGADEEAEFSLDGRLATIKRWRAFRAREAQANAQDLINDCEDQSMLVSSPNAFLPCTPPGLLSTSSPTPTLGPPGLLEANDEAEAASALRCHLEVGSLGIIRIEASRLMDSGVLWLEQQIRVLSREALGVDAWEQLANPSPDDPEWQLLALVGKGCIVGFCTYAFFEEGPGSIMSVHHLLISEHYRGMGCGHKLVMDLFQRAQDVNAWAVKLYSRLDAIEFYKKFGFSSVGTDDLMEYRLP